MGNYKFRLSDMIPNAWFYKLKDMSRSRSRSSSSRNPHHQSNRKQSSTTSCSATATNSNNNININGVYQKRPPLVVSSQSQSQYQSQQQHRRQSFYYSRCESFTPRRPPPVYQNSPTDVYFPADPPRKSSKRRSRSRTRRKTVYKPSPRRVTAAALDDEDDCTRSSCQCQEEEEAPSFAFSSNSLQIQNQKNYFDSLSTTTNTDASLEFFDLLKYAPNGAGVGGGGGGTESRSSTCSCGFSSSQSAATTDIIIDVNEKCFDPAATAGINSDHANNKLLFDGGEAFDDRIPELDLPPILTKPTKLDPIPKQETASLDPLPLKTVLKSPTPSSGLRGIKIRANSPKVLATKKNQGQGVQQGSGGGRTRKSTSNSKVSQKKKVFSESFAVVKSSFDPQKDFRDSMMEMIVENNIRASKDLEELLACYLSLNSDEYHHLIIQAFEQIWFHIPRPS